MSTAAAEAKEEIGCKVQRKVVAAQSLGSLASKERLKSIRLTPKARRQRRNPKVSFIAYPFIIIVNPRFVEKVN